MIFRNFDKNGTLKAMSIALIITLAGLAVLGWQYRQLEEKRLPALEEEIEKQKVEMEKSAAQEVLRSFMTARIEGQKQQAMLYLTENAAESLMENQFNLIGEYDGFLLISAQDLNNNIFRFAVKLYFPNLTELVELITLVKVVDNYYVDLVELAG
jgi:hypothetical protein